MTQQNKIADRLEELRKSRKWSKTYVANRLGKTLSTYANWEYGAREPDADTLIKLANLYNVSVSYILGTTDNPNIELSEEENKDLKQIDDLELRKFVAEISKLPIEDLNKIYSIWKIVNKK